MADSCSLTLHHSWPLLLQRVFLSFALSRNPFQYHTTTTEQQTSLWSVFTRTDTRGQADRPHITLLGTLQAETPFILFLIKDGKRGVPSIASWHWSHRSPNFWTRRSCFLSSNRFFQCEHPFIDKSMVITVTWRKQLKLQDDPPFSPRRPSTHTHSAAAYPSHGTCIFRSLWRVSSRGYIKRNRRECDRTEMALLSFAGQDSRYFYPFDRSIDNPEGVASSLWYFV